MNENIAVVDVREDIRSGREPFSRIMQATAQLEPEQELVLLAPFEPAPLYAVLARQGFAHHAKAIENGDWEVRFRRLTAAAPAVEADPPPPPSAAVSASSVQSVLKIDARGLEPPQPLVKILEAVASLPAAAQLQAHTDRRPMHLYAQLEARGFAGKTEEQPDGSFITYVSRR